MKQSICCSETEPKERERHSCKMPDGMGVDDPVDGREVKKLKSHTGGDQENSSNPVLYVPTIRPVQEKPGQPGNTVETTRGNIDLHVVAVVKVNSRHVENMVSKEGQKSSDNGKPNGAGTGGRDAEVECKERCKDCGQGGEVVGHLGDRRVHRVEHRAHDPSIDSSEAVPNPHPVHCSLVGNSFCEPDDHIDVGRQV